MNKETFPPEAAEIYDPAMADYDFKKAANMVDGVIKTNAVDAKNILEIGIGTGLLAEQLIDLGYSIAGIDHSAAMIAKARKRLADSVVIEEVDVKDFKPDHKYDVVLSHAGPIRLDYIQERGYFLETYLPDMESVESSIQHISDSLVSGGLFIMSIQHYEGGDPSISAPTEKKLTGNRTAVSQIIEKGEKRIKIRELKEGDKTIFRLEHTFFTVDMDVLDQMLLKYGFKGGQFDAEKKLFFAIKQ